MTAAVPTKKATVILLRWVLIIAFSYLLLLDASVAAQVHPRVVLLIAFALASNLVISHMPEVWTDRPLFDFGIVLFDASWVTLGLIWAPKVSSDLFLLYFLVIFVAAMGESLLTIVASAAVVGVVYGATLSLQPGSSFHLATTALLRVPFLFVVALFYGYFVTEIRSRRSEASEARLRENAKSELLAAVSHDLRGPLGNAESLLELALEGHGRDRGDTHLLLLRAQANVRRVSSLVTNLLQAAAIEAGKLTLQPRPVQVNDVVEDVFTIAAGGALLKNITLHKELDPQAPSITADFMQMGRIVANLVDNAIKYTAAGGRVVIRTRHDPSAVTLSVQDTGSGMTAEQCAALFAPYRRVHLGGYTPGTGLGLYIVKRLTEAQGGTVRVESTPGLGSTFTVSFPLDQGNAEVKATISPQVGGRPSLPVRRKPLGPLPGARPA